jgi:hypothetical protein
LLKQKHYKQACFTVMCQLEHSCIQVQTTNINKLRGLSLQVNYTD